MPHTFSMIGDDILCMRYTHAVDFTERREAITNAAQLMRARMLKRILVDYTNADLISSDDGLRCDFMATAITVRLPAGFRMATVGLPASLSRSVGLVFVVRQLEMRAFDDSASAEEWLRSEQPGDPATSAMGPMAAIEGSAAS